MTDTDRDKRLVGEAAARLIEPGMVVGLGTGTTARWLVEALASRKLDVTCVATSRDTERNATQLGLRLVDLGEIARIDVTIDGADEIGPGLSLIKGGGGALLREKLVWEASDRCVVIADASKQVDRLGAVPLPIEVVRFGHGMTLARIRAVLDGHGIHGPIDLRMRDGAPFVTDSGNVIYDAHCGAIDDPTTIAARLKAVTGVVEHGLFLDLATECLIGKDGAVQRLGREAR